ncbi:MAG: hypothetical protein AB1601_16755 [Planctomycetota bacterium]
MDTVFNERQRQVLRAAFADTATNVPDFTRTAVTGGHRTDEGLDKLLPAELTDYGKRCALKEALVKFLDDGRAPSVEVASGDPAMQLDAATFFHFRVGVEGVPPFVKVFVDEEDREPDVKVISVKRDYRAWSES